MFCYFFNETIIASASLSLELVINRLEISNANRLLTV